MKATIQKLIHHMIRRPKKMALKIPLAYFLVILLSVAFSYVILTSLAWNSAQKQIHEGSLQTLTSVQTNVELLVDNVNNYSKMIFSDSYLQSLLRQGDLYANLQSQSQVSQYLNNLMQTVPIIDSVFIFDHSGHQFSVGTYQTPRFLLTDVQDAPWYEEVVAKQGKYILRLPGSGVFSRDDASDRDAKIVSFIRLIRDIDDTSPLGILILNIPESAFIQAYANLLKDEALQIVIMDEHQQIITAHAAEGESLADTRFNRMLLDNRDVLREKLDGNSAGSLNITFESQRYNISYLQDERYNWTFASISPYHSIYAENYSLVLLALAFLIFNGLVFYISSIVISRNIIQPIHQLLRSMKSASRGEFAKVTYKPKSDEFEQLFSGYNSMIEQIHELLERIIEEQNMMRQAELNTLQAQIKPHFLYNTLDSISSLALSGQNEQVSDLLEALGSYYRVSVSKGRDVITLGEELEMVRNYLKIQKARYDDLFEAEYELDENCLHVPILKLVLQPLVENSLYHGLRKKGVHGTIRLSASRAEHGTRIVVADDGVGMTREEIEQLMADHRDQPASFGLRGTLERLRIYYNGRSDFIIDSEPGKGTKITIWIPDGEERQWID